MGKHGFMKIGFSKYTSCLANSIYKVTSDSLKEISNFNDEKQIKHIKKEDRYIKEKLKGGLWFNQIDSKSHNSILDKDIKFREISDTEILKSDFLEITVDKKFPNIVQYKIGNKIIQGSRKSRDEFLINGIRFKPKVTSKKIYDNLEGEFYLYKLNFRNINVEISISFKIINNRVKIQFEEIIESGEFKIFKIQIPNQNLLSISEEEERFSFKEEKSYGILKSNYYFYDLKEMEIDKEPVKESIAFLNNGELIASLENNVPSYENKIFYQTILYEDIKEVNLWNGEWVYRGDTYDICKQSFNIEKLKLPWSEIIVSEI